MHRSFQSLLGILFGVALCFLALPFLAIFAKGWGFLVQWPYPEEIRRAFWLSLRTSVLAATLCVTWSLGVVAFLETLQGRWARWATILFSLPMATPHLVSGIGLLSVFGRHGIGEFLHRVAGIDFVYTVSGISLAMVFVNLPFSVVTLKHSVALIDHKLLFTARTLGLNDWQVFSRVLIPLLKGPLIGLWLMDWARSMGEFGAIMVLVGVTRNKTETLATGIFLNLSTGDFDVAAGIAALLLIISVVVSMVVGRIMKVKDA